MKPEDFKAVPVEDIRNGCLGCCFNGEALCILVEKDELNALLVERDGDCYGNKRFIYESVNKKTTPLDQAKRIVKDEINRVMNRKAEPDSDKHVCNVLRLALESILTKLEEIK